jgi:iron(III) transport system substrate-binding protein
MTASHCYRFGCGGSNRTLAVKTAVEKYVWRRGNNMRPKHRKGLLLCLYFLTFIIVTADLWRLGPRKIAGANTVLYYRGSDRQKLLAEGARKEGKLVFYTTLAGDVRDQLAPAFEREYPFIKVQIYRADTTDLMRRVQTEFQTGRVMVDVIDQQISGFLIWKNEKRMAPFWTPAVDHLASSAKELLEKDKALWVINRESYVGFGYNSKLLPSAAIPKKYVDLLNPMLKGKMGLDGGSTGVRWLGGILANLTREDIERLLSGLPKQELFIQPQLSPRAMVDLMIRGEIQASPTMFQAHVLDAKNKGEPVDWVALEPVSTNSPAVGIPVLAPHPHAALLFVDFLLDLKKGQKMLVDATFGSPLKNPGFKVWYPETGKDVKAYITAEKNWKDQFNNTFVRPK